MSGRLKGSADGGNGSRTSHRWLFKLAFWAAVGLMVIMVGAIYTHVSQAEAPWGATIALLLLGFVAWQRRGSALLLS